MIDSAATGVVSLRWTAWLGILVIAAGCAGPTIKPRPGVALPPSGAKFSYQLGGSYPPAADVRIVARGRMADPVAGAYSICYVNAFQVQPDEVAWWEREHPELMLRNDDGLVVDAEWSEPLLDTRRPERLIEVIGPWLDACARAGYQAVEADNLDSFTRSAGLLDAADGLRFGGMLAARAHAHGLALAQKNSAELAPAARQEGFDFAVAEECEIYRECDAYTDVYGNGLIEIEYADQDARVFASACDARGRRLSLVRRDRALAVAGEPGHVEQWC